MNQGDPASLANLNDIVMPPALGWWPLADGWYVLAGIIIILLAWYIFRSVRKWNANAYRRAALLELQSLTESMRDLSNRAFSLRQLPSLLKRTALSVYPRENVAGLTGEEWFRFLNSKMGKPAFTPNTFDTLVQVSYSTGDLGDISDDGVNALVDACRSWLKHHSVEAGSEPQRGS